MKCMFCKITETITSNSLAYAIYDKYPIIPGHSLIIPKRHVADFFDTTFEERQAIKELIEECRVILDNTYSPDGYNTWINCGESAGQTVFHAYVGLIPWFKPDMDNPRGGVRGVIPEKRIY